MKQNRNRMIWMAAAVALLLTTGCSKETELQAGGAAYSDVQILPVSELVTDPVVVVPQSGTRAAADPTREMTFYLVRADETDKGTNTYGAYATTPLPAVRAAGAGATALTFATPQYYFVSNAKTKLTGWYPAATSIAGSVVNWTIDGAADLLTAAETVGSLGAPMPNLVFNHRLAQVQIHTYAPDANARDTWGTISKIEIMEQPNACTYDFSANAATGAITPKSGTTGTFTVGNITDATIPVATATQVGDPVMILPQATAGVLKLEVTTSKGGKVTVSMPAGVYAESKAYILKLRFMAYAIGATATIGEWQTVDRLEQETNPPVPPVVIGEVMDGGVVYWVDPADPNTYKVVSVTEAPTTLSWAAKDAYLVGPGAQSDTDARGNAAAIKKAYDNKLAGVAITESTFEAAFPAAAYCYNYQGNDGADVKGSWYLPAKTDLQYLWCAFNGKAPISWAGPGGSSAVVADAAAQVVFNKFLTDAGGDVMTTSGVSYYLSSTERNTYSTTAWYVYFLNGYTSYDGKIDTRHVRCIKNLPQPAVGYYYFTDGSFSSKMVSGKTVNGVIYYVDAADPTKFKVLALDESLLKWAANAKYVIGSGAQSLTDGRGNAAAIKAAFDSKMAGIAITESTFEAAFPAAAYCYNYTGKGGGDLEGTWYLPTRNELQYLYCAFNGAAPVIWDIGITGAPAADSGAQTKWNSLLTAAGGTSLGYAVWSSSESSESSLTSYAGIVGFSGGRTSFEFKGNTNSVRCVRDL